MLKLVLVGNSEHLRIARAVCDAGVSGITERTVARDIPTPVTWAHTAHNVQMQQATFSLTKQGNCGQQTSSLVCKPKINIAADFY